MTITWIQLRESITSPADGMERIHIPVKEGVTARIVDQCVAVTGPRDPFAILIPLANVRWMKFTVDAAQNPSREASASQGSRRV